MYAFIYVMCLPKICAYICTEIKVRMEILTYLVIGKSWYTHEVSLKK